MATREGWRLPDGVTLSADRRALMLAEADRIEAENVPAREEMILAIVGEMIEAFPMGKTSEESARSLARGFLLALGDLPESAIYAGYGRVMRAEIDRDHRYAPSPPQFRKICEPVMYAEKVRVVELRKFAAAADGAPKITEEDRARVSARMSEFVASLKTTSSRAATQ